MQQENLQRMQDSIGRLETLNLLNLATSQDLLPKINASLKNGQYEEAKLQMDKSIGSVFLYGSPELVELFQHAKQYDFSLHSQKEIDVFRDEIKKAFEQTFSAIVSYIKQ